MYEGRIAIDPAIEHGKPIIKGIRVPVEIVLGTLAGGMEIERDHRGSTKSRELTSSPPWLMLL